MASNTNRVIYDNGNNASISISSDYIVCESLYNGHIYLTDSQRMIIITLDIIVFLINVCTNGGVIYALKSTNLVQNTSIQLVFYLSISDCFVSLTVQPMVVVVLMHMRQNCLLENICQFFGVFFSHLSASIIFLIAFDRYLHMKFLNTYSTIVKAWKVRASLILSVILSAAIALCLVVGTVQGTYPTLSIVISILDLVLASTIFVTYMLTVRTVRKHRSESFDRNMMSFVDQTVLSIATRILIAIVILLCPYIILSLMRPSLNSASVRSKGILNFVLHLTYLGCFLNSGVNAIIFICLNKKVQKKIKSLFIPRKSQVYDVNDKVFTIKSGTFVENR